MIRFSCAILLLFSLLPSFGRADAVGADDANTWGAVEKSIEAQYPEISHPALDRAFNYLIANPNFVQNTNYVTVVDFDLPSTAERMFVIDLKSLSARSFWVAHGKNSGANYATHFSNKNNSYMSSLGIYVTAEPYVGEHGLSLRLQGMEKTNDNAYAREIVLHGADYVSQSSIDQLGRLGRSLGCPAVSLQYSTELVKALAGGSILVIYKTPN